jgi:DNA topoisomerase-1
MPPKRKHQIIDNESENDNESEVSNNSDDSDNQSNSDDDSDEDNDSDAEEEIVRPKGKKVTAKKEVKKANSKKDKESTKSKVIKKKAKTTVDTKSSSSSDLKRRMSTKLSKFERLEEARKAYLWWEAPELVAGINWQDLEHAGLIFAPPYVRHNIPIKYDGEEIKLTEEQEEVASFYAAIPEDGPQLGNEKTRSVFQSNFFDDFKKTFLPGSVVKKFNKCDFSAITKHLDFQKSLRKAATDEEKAVRKAEKDVSVLQYGYCLIDGRMEKMGNYNMEPPGLFRGRGEHPKTGTMKERCFAESVSINLSESAPIPKVSMPGHAWQHVRHDPAVTWLCSWNENVQGQTKYVMLAASSSFKGKSDVEKYSKAIRLKSCIGKVRKDYTEKIKSSDKEMRHLGTAMWVIDILALRVGGEKGEDEADTVGCCSLRVEHLTFNTDDTAFQIELEFLGKDSMLFKQNIDFSKHGDLGKLVYKCLKSFCAGKKKDEEVFDTLDPSSLNKHLTSLMKGLTAKVFRTYNASITLEKELPSAADLVGLSVQDKILRYNSANREVAILCNHQKTVSKAAETMFEGLNEKLTTLTGQKKKLEEWKSLAKKGKFEKIPLKKDDKDEVDKLQDKLKSLVKKKENAKSDSEKINAAEMVEAAKANLKLDQKRRFLDKHMFKTKPTVDSIDSRIKQWNESIRKMEVDIRNRDENKEVALGTSKINYMDPRISVAWCKRCEVPIDKVFAKTLRDKFNWAMAVAPTWKFE